MSVDLVAFGRAIALNLDSRPHRWLAERLGVSITQVGGYLHGINEPERLKVFRMEELFGLPPGTLSRVLGYVPVDAVPPMSVPDAVNADPALTPRDRRYLLALYDVATDPDPLP